jgi:hypothetical protein
MNRLKRLLGGPEEPERPGDFYEIVFRYEAIAVTRQAAQDVARQLDHVPPPQWIEFRDLSGAWHRVLASGITQISESTAAQRELDREFRRARRLEEKSGRLPWEDDEF